MSLPWRSSYERTCADCGYSWHVPRAFARNKTKPTSLAKFAGSPGDTAREILTSMAMNTQAQAFRRCPNCGAERYSQRRANS
jgi:predicted nucleic-acid-binding Zn-ribbon protein